MGKRKKLRSLRIAGQLFQVREDPELMVDRQRYGEVSLRTNMIVIDPGQCSDAYMETVLHEIIEVIDGCFGLELRHSAIKALSHMLFQVLRDNKLTF